MARPYAGEMAKLDETFAWAEEVDLGPVQEAVRVAGCSALQVIGSGGSLTGAHALAGLHQRYTSHLATVATPLEAVEEPLDRTVATWLLSARGSNNDIVSAARALIMREPRQIGVLCGRESSPLVDLCRKHPFVDLLLYPPPAGRDGFLATNSLFGFTSLLTRAYALEFGSDSCWRDTVDQLKPALQDGSAYLENWEAAVAPLWARPTTLVLYGPATRIGAIDIESKFTEAALGHVQLADYRNFAHGRHHWLAKHGSTSAVLAFVTNADRVLAKRTLELVPTDVPQARIVLQGGPNAVALSSLLAALRITGWAGRTRGIDPGRPGVPEFGRKLYSLGLPAPERTAMSSFLTPRMRAAIARKANVDHSRVATLTELAHWHNELTAFLDRLRHARFAGVVLDYDGTMVDTRLRSAPLDSKMASELTRIAVAGVCIGIATGRGASARRDLQQRIPRPLWPSILIGYYNGAEVASLDDNDAPDGTHRVHACLRKLARALRVQPELADLACQEGRPLQISLEATRLSREWRLWELAHQVIQGAGIQGVTVARSGHSVDILASGVSKINVVRRLRQRIGEEPILVIGDRGRWPGNDHELLSQPFALGVDEISTDSKTCWHLGLPGQRGTEVTLEYLSALEAENGRLAFARGSLK